MSETPETPSPPAPFPTAFSASSPRLERAIAATLRRQATRPELPWESFDASALDDEQTAALRFALSQMYFIETTSPRNLATLASSTPVASLRASYAAQMQDEWAHGAMFERYLTESLGGRVRVHPVSRAAVDGGRLVQHDPIMGAVGVLTGIEFFAVEVMDDLEAAVDEPLLRALVESIRVDENRHKVLALEAIRVLDAGGLLSGVRARARIRVGRRMTETFFRYLTCPAYQRACAPLGVDLRRAYERSLDQIGDAFRRELGPELVGHMA